MVEQSEVQNADYQKASSEREGRHSLEGRQRLSRSILWDLQRNFFEQRGVDAWRDSVVPHYITSNAFIADAFARLVLGYIGDCRACARDGGKALPELLDPGQPLYVVELGCGSGRFAFHFLREVAKIANGSACEDVPFRYIMTDLSDKNVDFWRGHQSLEPFVKEGVVDFARFDPTNDCELRLLHGGETLSADTVESPMVFIANYFFDSIPMDAFHIKQGRLYESLVSVSSSQEEPDLTDPEILTRMSVSPEHEPAEADYYDDPEWNRILHDYTERLADTELLFPTGALECIRNLRRLSGDRMLLLSADRGECREDELQGRSEPGFAVHGSFSLPVNYHAIGQYVVNQGGTAFRPKHHPASLVVCAFLFGDAPGGYAQTGKAYEEAIEAFGPDDFFTLKKGIEKANEKLSIDEHLAFLRLSAWDAKIFVTCFPGLMRQAEEAGDVQKREVYSAIQQVWSNYYPIGEETDLSFHMGTLLCQMRYYREAMDYFEHSLGAYGHSPGTDYNMALCYEGLREIEKALACVHGALKLEPTFEPARALRIRLESAIGPCEASEADEAINDRREPLQERQPCLHLHE